MTLSLVKETGAGLTNANSYADTSDGTSYHEAHLYATPWTNASSTEREKALVWSTRLLDETVIWKGRATNETQALAWPRVAVVDREGFAVNQDEIPQAIIDATCELARLLLQEDRTKTPDTLGFSYLRAGEVAMNIDKADRDTVGILTDAVKNMVRPFGEVRVRSPMTAKLVRV